MQRHSITLLVLLALASCARAGAPTATPQLAPTVPAVGEVLRAPTPGPIELLGYLLIDGRGAQLAGGLQLGDQPLPLGGALWLGELALPAETPLEERGGVRYAVASVRGQLEGPGRFGPDGLAYQISGPSVRVLGLRDLTVALLLGNSALYEGQAVKIRGAQILASQSSALLVEQLGPGGVPAAAARQIKLVGPLDPAQLAGLASSASGVRYGPAEVIGLWRGGSLYPLAIQP